ncbi:hypothetical protein SAMN06269173_104222 [Hymenobacter mucosus]|uniref:Uncharacterized protein n=1 Tax=Hymenobacter mucosus TaxID=1411120 RepID=A0A238XPK4_9BACT|nr:hypothetical protein SAMN06269173_104222 [Hymenobacter mucosus]
MLSRKWILRLSLTALALLVTTDRRRPTPAPPAKKPEDN